MAAPPIDKGFPELLEETLEHGIMKCIAFNRRGTLLAAGCANGSVIIWDFGFGNRGRGINKELTDKDACAPITSVCWSKNGHRILVSAADNSLTLWGVLSGEKISHITLQQTPIQAHLHPGSSTPSICLACSFYSPPMIVDMNTRTTTVLPVLVPDTNTGLVPALHNKSTESPLFSPTAACFNKYGDLVYMGSSKEELLITYHRSLKVHAVATIPGGGIKNIVFSRNGRHLLISSDDQTIRIYENLLPLKDELKALDEIHKEFDELDGVEKLKAVGSKCLAPFQVFQESITNMHWKALCFSGDGEWVVGGCASKEHKMYIWDKAGHFVNTLEGPKEALIDLAWHPVRHIVVSVGSMGLAYIWSKEYIVNWGPFSPDSEAEEAGKTSVSGDEEIDVTTVKKDPAFSDSDMSQEELIYLPGIICPDRSSSQLVSKEAQQDVSSSLEETDNSATKSAETDNSATEDTETDNSATEDAKTDNSATEEVKTDNSGTEDTKTDNSATEDAETDNSATEDAETDNSATGDAEGTRAKKKQRPSAKGL